MTRRAMWKPRLPQKKAELVLLASVLLIATALRVGWPTLSEFKFSEARLEALVLELTREGRLPLVGVPSSVGFDHAPTSVYLYIPPFLLTSNPVPATIYSGLAGVAAVLLCWHLSRKWPQGGEGVAFIAALLLAVSPWSVAFSRKIWQVAFVPPLAISFVGLTISALVEGRSARLVWSLVVFALLIEVHPSAISLAPALLIWLVVYRREVQFKALLTGVALGALTAVPFVVHQIQQGWPVLAAFSGLPEPVWDFSALRLAWEVTTGQGIQALAGDAYPLLQAVPQLSAAFGVLGWMTVGSALWLTWQVVIGWKAPDIGRQKQAKIDLFLLVWLVLPIAFNSRHSLDLHLHFFILMAPAAFLIIGRAIGSLLLSSRIAALRIASVATVGFVALAQVLALVLMGRFVATHDTSGGFGTPLGTFLDVCGQSLEAATETGADEVIVVGEGDSVVVDEVPAVFDVLLRGRISYRFVDGRSAALFPPHRALVVLVPGADLAAEWYQEWSTVKSLEGYRFVALDGSWPRDALQPISGPRLFENGIELQSFGWDSSTPTATTEVRVWLLWQSLWVDSNPSHFSVRLLNEDDKVLAQKDGVGYPTAYRRKGDRVLSKFDITLPQQAQIGTSGALRAVVSLYRYPELISLSVVDGAGSPIAGSVVLGALGGDYGP